MVDLTGHETGNGKTLENPAHTTTPLNKTAEATAERVSRYVKLRWTLWLGSEGR